MDTPPVTPSGSRWEPAAAEGATDQAGASWTSAHAADAADPAPGTPAGTDRRSRRRPVVIAIAALALALSGAGAFAVGHLVADGGPGVVRHDDAPVGSVPGGRSGHHHGHDTNGNGTTPDQGGAPPVLGGTSGPAGGGEAT